MRRQAQIFDEFVAAQIEHDVAHHDRVFETLLDMSKGTTGGALEGAGEALEHRKALTRQDLAFLSERLAAFTSILGVIPVFSVGKKYYRPVSGYTPANPKVSFKAGENQLPLRHSLEVHQRVLGPKMYDVTFPHALPVTHEQYSPPTMEWREKYQERATQADWDAFRADLPELVRQIGLRLTKMAAPEIRAEALSVISSLQGWGELPDAIAGVVKPHHPTGMSEQESGILSRYATASGYAVSPLLWFSLSTVHLRAQETTEIVRTAATMIQDVILQFAPPGTSTKVHGVRVRVRNECGVPELHINGRELSLHSATVEECTPLIVHTKEILEGLGVARHLRRQAEGLRVGTAKMALTEGHLSLD